jgi:hypothetical protein
MPQKYEKDFGLVRFRALSLYDVDFLLVIFFHAEMWRDKLFMKKLIAQTLLKTKRYFACDGAPIRQSNLGNFLPNILRYSNRTDAAFLFIL